MKLYPIERRPISNDTYSILKCPHCNTQMRFKLITWYYSPHGFEQYNECPKCRYEIRDDSDTCAFYRTPDEK